MDGRVDDGVSQLSHQGREVGRVQPCMLCEHCDLLFTDYCLVQMTCAKCGQHFCYRCGDKLLASNPYQHFSTPGIPCFSKLFDYQSTELEWQPVEGFDAL